MSVEEFEEATTKERDRVRKNVENYREKKKFEKTFPPKVPSNIDEQLIAAYLQRVEKLPMPECCSVCSRRSSGMFFFKIFRQSLGSFSLKITEK
jgi:hypothetical protein